MGPSLLWKVPNRTAAVSTSPSATQRRNARGTDDAAQMEHRGQLFHAEAVFFAQAAQDVGAAAAPPAQRKIVTDEQIPHVERHELLADELFRRGDGQRGREGELQHLVHAQGQDAAAALLTTREGRRGLSAAQHGARMRPEGQHEAAFPSGARHGAGAADQGLVAQMHAVEIADGQSGGRTPFRRRRWRRARGLLQT